MLRTWKVAAANKPPRPDGAFLCSAHAFLATCSGRAWSKQQGRLLLHLKTVFEQLPEEMGNGTLDVHCFLLLEYLDCKLIHDALLQGRQFPRTHQEARTPGCCRQQNDISGQGLCITTRLNEDDKSKVC